MPLPRSFFASGLLFVVALLLAAAVAADSEMCSMPPPTPKTDGSSLVKAVKEVIEGIKTMSPQLSVKPLAKDVVVSNMLNSDRFPLLRTFRGVDRFPGYLNALKQLNVIKYEPLEIAVGEGSNSQLVITTVLVEMNPPSTNKTTSFTDVLLWNFNDEGLISRISSFTNPLEIADLQSTGTSSSMGEKIAKRLFEAINNRALSDMLELFDKEATVSGLAPGPLNPYLFKHTIATMISGFPDAVFGVEDVVANNQQVSVVYTFNGTNKGSFMQLPATDKRVSVAAVFVFAFNSQGRITGAKGTFDFYGLQVQLGRAEAFGVK